MAIEDAPLREPDALEGVAYPEQALRVVGHETALRQLRTQFEGGRLPGCVLLHGPRGIGKATLAFQFAREVLAATGDEPEARVFAQVSAGSHPNLMVLRKQWNEKSKKFFTVIRVDDVRDYLDQLHRTRGRSGHRFAVVDAIDDANASTTNALLKIMEEPPEEMTFLLVSHRPSALLPTVRSRAQKLALRPLDDRAVEEVLSVTGASPGKIRKAVAVAAGRPRRAFEALALADAKGFSALSDWLAAPLEASLKSTLDLADLLGGQRDSAETRLGRELLLDFIAKDAEGAALSGDTRRLASANRLWDKATEQLADADIYNLDMRQTLVALFDAVRNHLSDTSAAASHSAAAP